MKIICASARTGVAGIWQMTIRLLDGEFCKVGNIMNAQPRMNVRVRSAELNAVAKQRSVWFGEVAQMHQKISCGQPLCASESVSGRV